MGKRSKKNHPKPPKMPVLTSEQQGFVERAEAAAADVAGRTPSRVINTFVETGSQIEGVQVQKCGLGILSLLEAINHPFWQIAINGDDVPHTVRDVMNALYIFAHPIEAKRAIAEQTLQEVAEAWVFEKEIPADAVVKAPFILVNMISRNMQMTPGFDPHGKPAAKKGEGNDPLARSQP